MGKHGPRCLLGSFLSVHCSFICLPVKQFSFVSLLVNSSHQGDEENTKEKKTGGT